MTTPHEYQLLLFAKHSPLKKPRIMVCQDCLEIYNFDQKGHEEHYFCKCGGQLCGCDSCVYDVQYCYRKYYQIMKGGDKNEIST